MNNYEHEIILNLDEFESKTNLVTNYFQSCPDNLSRRLSIDKFKKLRDEYARAITHAFFRSVINELNDFKDNLYISVKFMYEISYEQKYTENETSTHKQVAIIKMRNTNGLDKILPKYKLIEKKFKKLLKKWDLPIEVNDRLPISDDILNYEDNAFKYIQNNSLFLKITNMNLDENETKKKIKL